MFKFNLYKWYFSKNKSQRTLLNLINLVLAFIFFMWCINGYIYTVMGIIGFLIQISVALYFLFQKLGEKD